jgi:hypothetical protein
MPASIPTLRPRVAAERLLDAVRAWRAGTLSEDGLFFALLVTARARAAESLPGMPPWVVRTDVEAELFARAQAISSQADPRLDVLQIYRWIHESFSFALLDFRRSQDPLPKRKRDQRNRLDAAVEALEEEAGRPATASERYAIARGLVPAAMAVGASGHQEVLLLVQPPTSVRFDLDEVEGAPWGGEPEPAGSDQEPDDPGAAVHVGALDADRRTQAVHVAAALLDDDRLFADFSRCVARRVQPEEAAALVAALTGQLAALGLSC